MKNKSLIEHNKIRPFKKRQELTQKGYSLSHAEKIRRTGKKQISTKEVEKISEGYFRFINN